MERELMLRKRGMKQTIKRSKKLKKEGYKVAHLCEILGISRSSDYKWLKRKPTASENRLRQLIK